MEIQLVYNELSNYYEVEKETPTVTFSGTAFSPLDFSFAEQRLLPNSPNELAIHFFTLSPTFKIPSQSVIIVSFPNDASIYSSMYSDSLTTIHCVASGGITLLKGCVLNSFDVEMETYEHSVPNVNITLEYHGLMLYSGSENTDVAGFDMKIKYKGNIVAQADAATIPPAAYKTMLNALMDVIVDFYPRNEGERGFYTFNATFDSQQDLVEDQNSFLIRFPKEFDPMLGPYPLIVTSSQLKGRSFSLDWDWEEKGGEKRWGNGG